MICRGHLPFWSVWSIWSTFPIGVALRNRRALTDYRECCRGPMRLLLFTLLCQLLSSLRHAYLRSSSGHPLSSDVKLTVSAYRIYSLLSITGSLLTPCHVAFFQGEWIKMWLQGGKVNMTLLVAHQNMLHPPTYIVAWIVLILESPLVSNIHICVV